MAPSRRYARHGRRAVRSPVQRDLADEQTTRMYGQVERQRRYPEAVHARLLQFGFPESDLLLQATAAALRGVRELTLSVAGQLRKGAVHQALRRAKSWWPV